MIISLATIYKPHLETMQSRHEEMEARIKKANIVFEVKELRNDFFVKCKKLEDRHKGFITVIKENSKVQPMFQLYRQTNKETRKQLYDLNDNKGLCFFVQGGY